MKCEECKYFKIDEPGYGECHRFPPKTFLLPESEWEGEPTFFHFVYPSVYLVDWCGEFKEKQYQHNTRKRSMYGMWQGI